MRAIQAKQSVVMVVLLLTGFGGLVSTGNGATVTYYFGGTVDSVNDPDGVLAGRIVPGHPWSGSYTFDPTVPDGYPLDPAAGLYTSVDSVLDLSVGMLVVPGIVGSARMGIGNGQTADGLGIEGLGLSYVDAFVIVERGIYLVDNDAVAWSSDAIPASLPPISAFEASYLWFQGRSEGGSRYFGVTGTITHLVPEPATACLLLVGLLCARRRLF